MNNISIKYVDGDPNSITYEKQIDLDSLGIKNDGTAPQETSAGLNQALQYAKELDINKLVFPKGFYLLDETNLIVIDFKNVVIDFDGSTLQENPGQSAEYSVVVFEDGAEDVWLTNVIIRGDKDSLDHSTPVDFHQRGCGIVIKGGKNLHFDNIIVKEFTGPGINAQAADGDILWEFTDTHVFK